MNVPTVLGSFYYCTQLFSLLHNYLLPIDNTLSINMYFAKTLTQHIGLKYRKIHACNVGCVLYRGPYANYSHYLKCGRARFKQVGQTQVLEKILCHFPIILRLKWMYQSPSMVELLQWHEKTKTRMGLCTMLQIAKHGNTLRRHGQILQVTHKI